MPSHLLGTGPVRGVPRARCSRTEFDRRCRHRIRASSSIRGSGRLRGPVPRTASRSLTVLETWIFLRLLVVQDGLVRLHARAEPSAPSPATRWPGCRRVLCTRAALTIWRVVWASLHTFRRTVSVCPFIVPRPSLFDASVAPGSLYWYTVVDGYAKAPKSGEHKIWGLTSRNGVFSQTGPVMAGSPLPAMKIQCIRRLRQVTRRAGAQRRSREAA